MPRHWSEEAKEAARQRIYQNKPWIKSTDPKSEQGNRMLGIFGRKSRQIGNQKY